MCQLGLSGEELLFVHSRKRKKRMIPTFRKESFFPEIESFRENYEMLVADVVHKEEAARQLAGAWLQEATSAGLVDVCTF